MPQNLKVSIQFYSVKAREVNNFKWIFSFKAIQFDHFKKKLTNQNHRMQTNSNYLITRILETHPFLDYRRSQKDEIIETYSLHKQRYWSFRMSISWTAFPRRMVTGIFSLQEHVNFMKRRPLWFVPAPAVAQEIVDLTGTKHGLVKGNPQSWTLQKVIRVDDDLFISQRFVRLSRKCQHFPHCHRKWPDVAFCGEVALQHHEQTAIWGSILLQTHKTCKIK